MNSIEDSLNLYLYKKISNILDEEIRLEERQFGWKVVDVIIGKDKAIEKIIELIEDIKHDDGK